MKIVVDTNVIISGVFFGGAPGQVLKAIISARVTAYATSDIIDEYNEIVDEMITRKQGKLNRDILMPLINSLEIKYKLFFRKIPEILIILAVIVRIL